MRVDMIGFPHKHVNTLSTENDTPLEMGQYPLDVDEMECNRNGKTRPMALVMVPTLEKAS
jgi:hypothetical protein